MNLTAKDFDKKYFAMYYEKRNWLGTQTGERSFLYHYWMRKVRRLTKGDEIVLEVGCGLGFFLRHLIKERPILGIDISMDALQVTKKSTEASLIQASAEVLPLKNRCFSLAIALDLIEHLPHPERFFAEIGRVLKRGGVFIISTPNPSSFGARVKVRNRRLEVRTDAERDLEWYGWRDSTHISIRTISNWRDLLKSSGFVILQDGTDTLWDVPYFKGIPYSLQKAFFISLHWTLTWAFGFFPWKWGENYVCIARKVIP